VKSIRLLPIIMVAATALLLLKTTGLVTRGGYVLSGTEFAQAQTTASGAEADDGQGGDARANGGDRTELSDVEAAAARRAADSLFSRQAETPLESRQIDAVPIMENKQGEKVEFGAEEGSDLTEQALLDRLGERRMQLDSRADELDMREDLVEAAEKRLDERIAALEDLEARVQALVDERKAIEDEQFAALVSMYESMKPDEAATVFNTLDMSVLQRLARNMSARKMSPILAEMQTERAQELTLILAVEENMEAARDAPPADDFSDLPQIVGQ